MAARIAIVNHDPVFLRLVKQILTLDGYETIICPGGGPAHEVIRTEKPDLVILDTWLENRESGWILLQTLLLDDATKDIAVIISTTEVADYEQRAAHREDLTNIRLLAKPFKPEQLLAVVHEILGDELEATGTGSS